MLVDTTLLRMRAAFSRTSGTIVRHGANEFVSTQFSDGTFGDFEAAHGFRPAFAAAHEVSANPMAGHHAELDGLAEKADSAATLYCRQDERLAEGVTGAGNTIGEYQ